MQANRPKMKKFGSILWIGSHNGKTINAFRNGRQWTAKADGGHGSMIVCVGKTMREAVQKVIDDFWF